MTATMVIIAVLGSLTMTWYSLADEEYDERWYETLYWGTLVVAFGLSFVLWDGPLALVVAIGVTLAVALGMLVLMPVSWLFWGLFATIAVFWRERRETEESQEEIEESRHKIRKEERSAVEVEATTEEDRVWRMLEELEGVDDKETVYRARRLRQRLEAAETEKKFARVSRKIEARWESERRTGGLDRPRGLAVPTDERETATEGR